MLHGMVYCIDNFPLKIKKSGCEQTPELPKNFLRLDGFNVLWMNKIHKKSCQF
jgi:hypothetical protein